MGLGDTFCKVLISLHTAFGLADLGVLEIAFVRGVSVQNVLQPVQRSERLQISQPASPKAMCTLSNLPKKAK